ncbi:MAG: hybrid sensor histidine kinase/response regulator [Deltaproteobacteria bacterium]|nr:hybrid sensor histidine kinase/response regulator [Deltaproteobacteria bacterium]
MAPYPYNNLELKPENVTILVVDDDPSIRHLLKAIVEQQGNKVLDAGSGKEALEIFDKNGADIVMTDLLMPEMDGIRLTQNLLERKPQLPIIVITGFADKEVAVNALRAGAYDIVEKPFEPEDVILPITRAMGKIRLETLLAQNIEELKSAQIALETAKNSLAEQVSKKTSELMQTNQELERRLKEVESAISQLKEFDRRKTEFIAMASHELRTPLAIMKTAISNLMAGIKGPLSPPQITALQVIDLDIDRFTTTINELLNLSKIESGQLTVYLEPANLPIIISHILQTLHEEIEKKKLQVDTKIPENLPPAFCDRDKTEHILLNIVGNAVKYLQEGGRMLITASPKDEFVEMSIADNGPGIAPDQLAIIFDKFKKIATTSKKIDGLGLGLAIAKEFANVQGGTIAVTSEVGKGSTFTVTLPSILREKATSTVPLKKIA